MHAMIPTASKKVKLKGFMSNKLIEKNKKNFKFTCTKKQKWVN